MWEAGHHINSHLLINLIFLFICKCKLSSLHLVSPEGHPCSLGHMLYSSIHSLNCHSLHTEFRASFYCLPTEKKIKILAIDFRMELCNTINN